MTFIDCEYPLLNYIYCIYGVGDEDFFTNIKIINQANNSTD